MRATIVLVVCLLGTVCCQLVVNASETFTCNTIARFNIRYCGNYFPKPTQSSVQVYHRPEHPFLYIDEGFVPKETDDDDDDTNNALFGEPVSVRALYALLTRRCRAVAKNEFKNLLLFGRSTARPSLRLC